MEESLEANQYHVFVAFLSAVIGFLVNNVSVYSMCLVNITFKQAEYNYNESPSTF